MNGTNFGEQTTLSLNEGYEPFSDHLLRRQELTLGTAPMTPRHSSQNDPEVALLAVSPARRGTSAGWSVTSDAGTLSLVPRHCL